MSAGSNNTRRTVSTIRREEKVKQPPMVADHLIQTACSVIKSVPPPKMVIGLLFAGMCVLKIAAQIEAAENKEHIDERRRELQVLQHLLEAGYTYYTRPLTPDNATVEVRLRVSLIKIQNLWERTDVKTEALETTMRIQLNWCDEMLSWHPSNFGGVDSVIIPGDKLWIPDLQIINALDDVYTLTRDRRFDFKLHFDGCVWWYPTGTTLTRCQLDLSYFPFDVQTCPIIFESAMYPKEYLNLTMRYDRRAVSLKTFTENGQWDLLSATAVPRLNYVTESTAFSRVEVILRIGRKTLYYQMNVLCPCGMLSALQVLTFLLPIGSEDRIHQSTTVLLSFIVFQSVAVAELPRTSTSIPLLCLYIDFLTSVSVITVTNAILSVYLLKTTAQRKMFSKNKYDVFRCLRRTVARAAQQTKRAAQRSPLKAAVTVKRISVGTSVTEADIFDEDSLDAQSRYGRPPIVVSGNLESSGLFVGMPISSSMIETVREVCDAASPMTDDEQRPSKRKEKILRTITIYIDDILFIIALVSTVLVPIYMFSILPPLREEGPL